MEFKAFTPGLCSLTGQGLPGDACALPTSALGAGVFA